MRTKEDRLNLKRNVLATDIVAAIDAFMAAPKRIVGADWPSKRAPGWGPQELEMKYPLEVGGEQRGQNGRSSDFHGSVNSTLNSASHTVPRDGLSA